MDNEELGELFRSAGDNRRNEDGLFGETVDNHQDGIKAFGVRKGFDEVHGDRIPRTRRNGELLECAVGFVELRLGTHAGSTRLAIVPDIASETGPVKVTSDKTKGLVDS